jgi:phospholipid/cholesterol/gamma-HCH transport system substrate-binding protein
VEIGQVIAINLDPTDFQARITMRIDDSHTQLPADTSASINSAGILGDNYITLSPGYANSNLAKNGEITTTYAATSLESLISTFMSGNTKTRTS